MLKTIVTPLNTSLKLTIPKDYVGKEVEVLLYTTEEINQKAKRKPGYAAGLKGILNKDEAKKFHQYLKESRKEWGRNI